MEEFTFHQRALNLLSQQLNLTWVECFSLKWEPVVRRLEISNPEAILANPILSQLTHLAKPLENNGDSLIDIAKKKASLAVRLSTFLNLMNKSLKNGELELFLSNLEQHSRPGAPAIINKIISNRTQLVEFSKGHHKIYSASKI
jgi:hypothetical protein